MTNLLPTATLLVLRTACCLIAALPGHSSGDCPPALAVTNDGPVTLDVPVTVSAALRCDPRSGPLEFVFEDVAGLSQRVVEGTASGASLDFVFSDHPGERVVCVTARRPLFGAVASAQTTVQVEEHIPGSLEVSGTEGEEEEEGAACVATGRDTDIRVRLLLPARALRGAELAFSWTVGEQRFSTDRPQLTHRFEEEGRRWVHVAVAARMMPGDRSMVLHKWGYFDREVVVKDPFSSINISGNTYLEHGQLLDLEIVCNGSGPVEYCWKVLPPQETNTSLSCSETATATECAFPILYYFRDSGHFQLAMYVSNRVTAMQRTVGVHVYDVSLRPQLSTVTIPVVCTVLVVLIVAGAVLLHMRRAVLLDLDVETADFDFLRPDEPAAAVAVETSWQVMRRSLAHLLRAADSSTR